MNANSDSRGSASSRSRAGVRAHVDFRKEYDGTYEVMVDLGNEVGDGKKVVIQRLTSAGWKMLRTVVVRATGTSEWAKKDGLRLKVPKRTLLRAVLPLPQARPCHLAGYSALLRT